MIRRHEKSARSEADEQLMQRGLQAEPVAPAVPSLVPRLNRPSAASRAEASVASAHEIPGASAGAVAAPPGRRLSLISSADLTKSVAVSAGAGGAGGADGEGDGKTTVHTPLTAAVIKANWCTLDSFAECEIALFTVCVICNAQVPVLEHRSDAHSPLESGQLTS